MSLTFNHHDLVDVAVKGIFCVKLPANVRSTGAWKVWSPKLFVIKPQTTEISSRTSNKLILTIFKSYKIKDTSQSFVIQEILNPSRTIIFRCKSRKKPHAFTIYGDGKPLVHISGDSESESQLLIRSIRNLLWPPNPILSLSKALGSVFDVSIIDNEMSYRAGLLGVCGYLTITSDKVTLTCPQTGHVIQEWSMFTVSFRLIPQLNVKDNNKVINMKTNEDSSTGLGNILIYCEEASEIINQVNRVRLQVNHSPMKPYSDELFQSLATLATSEYDLMLPRFDDLDDLNCPNLPSTQSISDRSSFTSNTSSNTRSLNFNQSLQSSLNLSSSWSTNRSSLWSGSDDVGGYDVPRPVNTTISTSSSGYASITRRPSSAQQSMLNTIPNLSSSVLDCSLNGKQQWLNSSECSNYVTYETANLATSLPATANELLQDDHIYEEIKAIKDRLDNNVMEDDKFDDDGDNDDIYEIIEPLRQTLFEEAENIYPKVDNKLNNSKNKMNDDVKEMKKDRPKSKAISFITAARNKQGNNLVKSSPKGISRFNYFKFARSISDSV